MAKAKTTNIKVWKKKPKKKGKAKKKFSAKEQKPKAYAGQGR